MEFLQDPLNTYLKMYLIPILLVKANKEPNLGGFGVKLMAQSGIVLHTLE